MRFDRCVGAVVSLVLAGCPDEKPTGTLPSRFDAVTTKPSAEASRFCDQALPAEGDKSRPWLAPPLRVLEGTPTPVQTKGWRWVNAWATWCTPCLDEMALLTRWRDAFQKDGVAVSFELLSIDATEKEAELRKWLTRDLAGPVMWVKSPDDFPLWLEKLGVNPDSSVPMHLLIDPAGRLRCVRVGAVHAQDYGSVRALLTGG